MNRLPDGFDAKNQLIAHVFWSDELQDMPFSSRRWVKIYTDGDLPRNRSVETWAESAAPAAWQAKYGEKPPYSALRVIRTDTLSADAIPYDGPTQLTNDEQATIVNFLKDSCTDLTMGMLYLMVEGFGWRPSAFVGRDALPDESEMAEFYAYCIEDDPDGTLTIALDLLCTAPDGKTDLSVNYRQKTSKFRNYVANAQELPTS